MNQDNMNSMLSSSLAQANKRIVTVFFCAILYSYLAVIEAMTKMNGGYMWIVQLVMAALQ